MIKNARVFSGLTLFFWSTLIIELVLLELTSINITLMIVPLIVSTIGTMVMIVIFVIDYKKSKPHVQSLKKEYLESLKPKQPLRFCASDDELLKAYKASAKEVSMKQQANRVEEKPLTNTNPETKTEEELSM